MSKHNKDANKPQQKWYFVTNHQNLLMYLAMNTISSSFINDQKKYYQDSLIEYPGWIPLFSQEFPEKIIVKSQSGSEGDKIKLKPVLLEISLSNYNDMLFAYSIKEAKWIETNILQLNDNPFIDETELDTPIILIPSHLATGTINSIKVPTLEVQKLIEDKAQDTNNINVSAYKITPIKSLFEQTSNSLGLPHDTSNLPNIYQSKSSYGYVNAIASVYAVVSILANVNNQALNTLLILLKQPPRPLTSSINNTNEDMPAHPKPLKQIVDTLCQWVLQPNNEITDLASKLFIDIVNIIIDSNNTVRSKQRIIELLESTAKEANSEQSQHFVTDLSNKIGVSSKSFEELIESYSEKPLNRVLLMFFYAEKIERFLDADKSRLNETEIVLAAVLVAVNGGWLKLPNWIKSYADIEKPISFIMAKLGHLHTKVDASINPHDLNKNLKVSVVDFDNIDFPMPIRCLLMEKWNKPQQEAAKVLIKEQKWDCIDYEVIFPQGSYEFDTTKTYLKIKSKSEIKVKEIVNQNKFLHLMSQLNYIDAETEKSMRGKL